jgi:asparagine synthase (glutamine-hydrolysing)
MCGISGFLVKNDDLNDCFKLKLYESLSIIQHRGPDASDVFNEKNVGLGHVRLSILDLTDAANQPMCSTSGRFVIVFNGEVYNFREIADELGLINLKTKSDTEIILLAFEKIGTLLFEKLNGMFSIAIYDRFESRMWLVRDRIGIKPLYVFNDDASFIFSSEIKGITAFPAQNVGRVNECALHEWSYYGNSLGERTLYKNISKVLPGHYVEINTENFTHDVICYWSIKKQLDRVPPNKNVSYDDSLIEKTRSCLESAVKRQLVSDVPVSVFLSGGIDSSAITAFASKHYQGKLKTFSVAFDYNLENNELQKAKLVADKFGTDHNELHISGSNVADIVEKMVYHNDSPFSDAANIPLYLLCEEIKDETKVVLQGDGGDELFGGYQRYFTLAKLPWMRPLSQAGNIANKLLPKNADYFRRERYFNALLANSDAEIMALLLTVEQRKYSPLRMFSDDVINRIANTDPFIRYREVEQTFSGFPIIDKMFYVDKSIILPDIFLEKVDKATMASSIEVRVPFLDNELVDFCLSLPAKIKIKNGIQKGLLKRSLEGIVPNEILYGKKMGFGVPFEYWIKTSLFELLNDHLSGFYKKYPNILSAKRISTLIFEHSSGKKDNGFLLWKLLNFVIWANNNNLEFSNNDIN